MDADYPDHKLSEAVFEVYADVDNNGEFNADIDKLAGEMTETEPGSLPDEGSCVWKLLPA